MYKNGLVKHNGKTGDKMAYKISVIIPVHNIEEWIEETLESVVKQTIGLENLEVVIVDDCSTDNTCRIIDDYADKYDNFVVEHLSENSGLPGKPRNVGMKKARGNYIMFLDHDDLYAEDICETLYNRITNENVDIVYCRYMNLFDDNRKMMHPYVFDEDIDEIKVRTIDEEQRLFLNPPSIWTKIFKKSFLEENNILFPEDTLAEDIAFMAQAYLKADGIIFLNSYVGYYYRIRQSENRSTIFSRKKKVLMDLLNGYHNIYNIWKDAGKEEYFYFNCKGSLPFWVQQFILSDLTRAGKRDILNRAEFLFEKYGFYGLNHPAKHINLFINLVVNKNIDDAILLSEIWTESAKNQLRIEDELKKVKQLKSSPSKDVKANEKVSSKIDFVEREKRFQELNYHINDLTFNVHRMKYSSNKSRSLKQRLISSFPSLYILLNKENKGIKRALVNIKGYKVIKKNHLFDIGYYLKNNPDVELSGMDPLIHYIYYGYKEGRNPSSKFNNDHYLKTHIDIENMNPLIHYSLHGLKQWVGKKNKGIKLSVLIIFHNQVNYVRRCIESVLSQKTNFDYEIIIGDDSSTDGTWDEIQKYVKKYPNISAYQVSIEESSLYTNSQRSGINRANILKHAQGEYFNFIDGDDFIIDENRFQLQIDALEKNMDCVGCACGVSYYKEVNGALKFQSVHAPPNLPSNTIISPSFYIKNHFFPNFSIVFRNINTDIYEKLDKTCFVDNYLTHYYLQYGGLIYIDKPMHGYFLSNQGSAWRNISRQEKLVTILYLNSVLLKIVDKFFYDICIKYKKEICECYNMNYKDLSPKYSQFVKSNKHYLLMNIPNLNNTNFIKKLKLKLVYNFLNSIDKDSKSYLKEKTLKFLINS